MQRVTHCERQKIGRHSTVVEKGNGWTSEPEEDSFTIPGADSLVLGHTQLPPCWSRPPSFVLNSSCSRQGFHPSLVHSCYCRSTTYIQPTTQPNTSNTRCPILLDRENRLRMTCDTASSSASAQGRASGGPRPSRPGGTARHERLRDEDAGRREGGPKSAPSKDKVGENCPNLGCC